MEKQPGSTTAGRFLARRRRGVIAVDPDSTVLAALKRMADEDIGVVLVIQDAKLVGILSERDYARRCDLQGRKAADCPVREIMNAHVVTVGPDHTFDQCMALMHRERFRHLPVLDAGKPLGVISSRDILAEALAAQTHLAKELEHERMEIEQDRGGSY